VLALILSILLAALGIAAFPCWPYSARWGYGPSIAAGGLLVLVAALTVGGRPSTEESRASRASAPTASALVEIATASPTGAVGPHGRSKHGHP